jgi:hypothetical protein
MGIFSKLFKGENGQAEHEPGDAGAPTDAQGAQGAVPLSAPPVDTNTASAAPASARVTTPSTAVGSAPTMPPKPPAAPASTSASTPSTPRPPGLGTPATGTPVTAAPPGGVRSATPARPATPATGTPITPATGTKPSTASPASRGKPIIIATTRTETPATGTPLPIMPGARPTPTPASGVVVKPSPSAAKPSAPKPSVSSPLTDAVRAATEATSPAKPADDKSADDKGRRAHSDSVSTAFDNVLSSGESRTQGVSSAEDLESVRKVFHEVSVTHVAQVRDVMLECRFGTADTGWLASTKPALRSLHAMALQIELTDLCAALDQFCAKIDALVAKGSQLGDEDKAELLQRYQRLIELIPQAFELDAERDRREPVIVEALLLQIDGVERITIDKLFAVGLNRLDALTSAKADEVEVVAGIRPALAAAIVEQFRLYRERTNAAVSVRDPAAERRELAQLLAALSQQNTEFVVAESGWDDDARTRKKTLRKQREHTFQRIKVALARLGAREQLSRLEKLSFRERIENLERYLQTESKVR